MHLPDSVDCLAALSRGCRHVMPVAALVLACGIPQASAAEPGDFSGYSVTTAHSGQFNGVDVDYTATFGDIVVDNAAGAPAASLFATAYVRRDVPDPAARPVLFIWSGGPSASSQTLHIAGFGPRRLVVPPDPSAPVEPPFETKANPATLLDVADLVFVDPADTGFSRVLPAGDRSVLFSADGDAASVAQFIQKWLAANEREDSPVFVLGSSYGSIRAALVAGLLAETDTPLAGAILVSQGVNLVETTQRSHNIVGYASNLSQQAAIAHYHGRGGLADEPVESVIDAAESFAMGDYLVALGQGRFLPEPERQSIAARLEELNGIDRATWLANDLMIRKTAFRGELLADENRVVGATDARYTAPAGERPAGPTAGVSDAQREHMTGFLGIELPLEEYRGFAPGTGSRWDYGGTSTIDGSELAPESARTVFADYDFPGALTPAFDANPAFRVMIATGIYDMLTTVGPARLLAANPAWPGDRITVREYAGGHAFYSDAAAFDRLAADLREYLRFFAVYRVAPQ